MYAKKITPAPRSTPLQPNSPNSPVFGGMNGCQFSVEMNIPPRPMISSTTATLITTITALTRADSRMPIDQQQRRRGRDQHRRQVEERRRAGAIGENHGRPGRGAEERRELDPESVRNDTT